MSVPFPEPTAPVATRAEVFLGYLDYFRDRLVSKLESLPEDELRRSRLPSGWTPSGGQVMTSDATNEKPMRFCLKRIGPSFWRHSTKAVTSMMGAVRMTATLATT